MTINNGLGEVHPHNFPPQTEGYEDLPWSTGLDVDVFLECVATTLQSLVNATSCSSSPLFLETRKNLQSKIIELPFPFPANRINNSCSY